MIQRNCTGGKCVEIAMNTTRRSKGDDAVDAAVDETS